jgi:exopolyphosphatase / guanosine-5'-triphosphate,3'-diphosphate pyrophosphatase
VRVATIDLGTNTVRLLVADSEPGAAAWRVIDHAQRVTRLGQGSRAAGRLAEAPAMRTTAVVVAALPCLELGRADLILPGIAIVMATLSRVGSERLIVSDWGLREGIMAEILAGAI